MKIRELYKNKEGAIKVLAKYELLDKIKELPGKQERALVAFLYLTGCRVSEVCTYIIERNLMKIKKVKQQDGTRVIENKPIYRREEKGQGIRKKQIEIKEGVMKIYNVRSLKRRSYKPRTIPIIIEKEQEIWTIFKEYYDSMGEDQVLFPFYRQKINRILAKVELYPHYLRHLRATNLVLEYDFSAAELKQFFNWFNSAPADTYVHLNVKNLIEKMKKN